MKFLTYSSFMNEDTRSEHVLSHRHDLQYDSDSKNFIEAFIDKFGKKNESFPSHMAHEDTYNKETDCPTIEFGQFNNVPDEWRTNEVSKESTCSYIFSLIGKHYFKSWYPDQNINKFEDIKDTMITFQPNPSQDVTKFCNSWGYIPYYTFIEFYTHNTQEAFMVESLLITFIKDQDMVYKHRGGIHGKNFGL